MKNLELFQEKPLLADKIELTPTSLAIRGDMNEADYELAWGKLAYLEGAIEWWSGDLWNAQEAKYGKRANFAEKHGLASKTLSNRGWICKKSSLRREDLSFQHHELVATMEPAEQREWLEEAVRHSWTVAELRNAIRDAKPIPELPVGVFNVIYADPPWQYDFSRSPTRAIENQYPTMELEQIKKMPFPAIAEDAVLLMWATSPKLKDALEVVDAWGFEYKTNMVWVKDKIGMGYYARQQHELLLIAGKGRSVVPKEEDRPPSIIEAPRLEHSSKPPEVRDIIQGMYPNGKAIELFARERLSGYWTSWGNEAC